MKNWLNICTSSRRNCYRKSESNTYKKKNNKNKNRNLNFKQNINYTFSIISSKKLKIVHGNQKTESDEYLSFNKITNTLKTPQENSLVIVTEPKITHFDFAKDLGNNLKYETVFIIHTWFLAENKIIKQS